MRVLLPLLCAAALLVPAAPAGAADGLWTDDLAAAQAQAAADGRDILLDFTGSDWCRWCITLKQEVFDTPEFRAAATASFVLVEIDFPRRKVLAPEVKARNEALGEAFGVEGYPTIWLADAAGRPYAKTGYQPGGPVPYLAHLAELRQRRIVRDAALAEAATLTGIAQAQALDRALAALGDDLPMGPYAAEIERIVSLDADGAAGLKGRYAALGAKRAIVDLLNAGEVDKARPRIAALMADPAAPRAIRQEMAMVEASIRFRTGDKAGALEGLKAALAIDPEGEQAAMLTDVIARLSAELGVSATAAPIP